MNNTQKITEIIMRMHTEDRNELTKAEMREIGRVAFSTLIGVEQK